MSSSANRNIIKHLRGSGIPTDWQEGEVAIDKSQNVLLCCIDDSGTGKAIGLITGSTEPAATAYRNTLWLDTGSTPAGIPASYAVANNLTTSSAGSYVLDAYQGKLLNDAITAQNTAIAAHSTSISNIEDDIDNLSVDYIVEQGTSGIWTYRKWSSGIAECWGITTASATDYNSARVFNYSGDNLINLPFSFINTTYCAFANVLEGNSANNNIAVATSTTSDILVTLSWNSSQTDKDICINVIGRWK